MSPMMGQGFTPRDDSPGAGLGLGLINALASSVQICPPRRAHGTEIHMTFSLAA
jgi:hypothetical protein